MERESLVSWAVSVSIIVSLEGVIVFLWGTVVCNSRVCCCWCVVVSGIPGIPGYSLILAWGSDLIYGLCVAYLVLLMPAVWQGLTPDSHPIIRFPMTKYE